MNGKRIKRVKAMKTVGIVLDTTWAARNLENITQGFEKKVENWRRVLKSNYLIPARDKVKLINQGALAKALYGADLSLNHPKTYVDKIDRTLQKLTKDMLGLPVNSNG